MFDFIADISRYTFLSNALWAALLSSVACGLIGTYVVTRRLVFMSGGITHASFGGVGIAYYLGLNPVLGAFVFAIAAAFGIEWGNRRGGISEDTLTGALWALGMSIGILFVFLTPGYAPNLMGFLFGNLLLVSATDIGALVGLNALLLLFFGVGYRAILATAFDRDFAAAQGVPTVLINTVMLALLAAAIVLSITTMGIVLLLSLLTMPVVIARLFSQKFLGIAVIASISAFLAAFFGVYFSYRFNIPAGAISILGLTVCYLLIRLFLAVKSRIS